MNKNILWTLSSLVLMGLVACGTASPLTQANLDKIHNDMTTADVKAILGMPSDSHTEPIPPGGTTTTYTYSGTSTDVVLVFKDDLLKEKHGAFSN